MPAKENQVTVDQNHNGQKVIAPVLKDETYHALQSAGHDALDSLAHDIVENCYDEYILDANGLPSQEIVWTNSGKTEKIRETIFIYNASNDVTSIVEKQYSVGILVKTKTITVGAYTAGFPTTATEVIT